MTQRISTVTANFSDPSFAYSGIGINVRNNGSTNASKILLISTGEGPRLTVYKDGGLRLTSNVSNSSLDIFSVDDKLKVKKFRTISNTDVSSVVYMHDTAFAEKYEHIQSNNGTVVINLNNATSFFVESTTNTITNFSFVKPTDSHDSYDRTYSCLVMFKNVSVNASVWSAAGIVWLDCLAPTTNANTSFVNFYSSESLSQAGLSSLWFGMGGAGAFDGGAGGGGEPPSPFTYWINMLHSYPWDEGFDSVFPDLHLYGGAGSIRIDGSDNVTVALAEKNVQDFDLPERTTLRSFVFYNLNSVGVYQSAINNNDFHNAPQYFNTSDDNYDSRNIIYHNQNVDSSGNYYLLSYKKINRYLGGDPFGNREAIWAKYLPNGTKAWSVGFAYPERYFEQVETAYLTGDPYDTKVWNGDTIFGLKTTSITVKGTDIYVAGEIRFDVFDAVPAPSTSWGYKYRWEDISGVFYFKIDSATGAITSKKFFTGFPLLIEYFSALGLVTSFWGEKFGADGLANMGSHHIDKDGNLIGTGIAKNVSVSGSEVYAIADGYFEVEPGEYTQVVWKLDSSLNVLWSKQLGTRDTSRDHISGSITTDSNGSVYVTGTHYEDSVTRIKKLDSSGNHLWTKTLPSSYGNQYFVASMKTDSTDKLYALIQYANPSAELDRLYVVCFSPEGNVIWQREILTDYYDGAAYLPEENVAGWSLNIGGTPESLYIVYSCVVYGEDVIMRIPLDGSLTGEYSLPRDYRLTYTASSLTFGSTAKTLSNYTLSNINLPNVDPISTSGISGAAASPLDINNDPPVYL